MNMPAPATPATFNPFLPFCLVALSVLIFLGWQTTEAVRQRGNLIRMADRQELLASQAAQAETQLQSLMMDLLALSKSDDDARAIVTKYNIKFNPPPVATGEASVSEADDSLREYKPAPTTDDAPATPVGSGALETQPGD